MVTGDYYTWKKLNDDVREYLPVDSKRIGAQGIIQLLIKQAVLDLQDKIPQFRKHQEDIYTPSDFAKHGCAGLGTLPPGAVQDAYLYHIESKGVFGLDEFQWQRRNELIYSTQLGLPKIAIAPDANKFYVHPVPTEGWLVSLWWDGLKSKFEDEEELPFPVEDARIVQAVADYVEGHLARKVKDRLDKYESYLHPGPGPRTGSYVKLRRDLFLTARERQTTKYCQNGPSPSAGEPIVDDETATAATADNSTPAQPEAESPGVVFSSIKLRDAVTNEVVTLTLKDGQLKVL